MFLDCPLLFLNRPLMALLGTTARLRDLLFNIGLRRLLEDGCDIRRNTFNLQIDFAGREWGTFLAPNMDPSNKEAPSLVRFYGFGWEQA